MMEILQIVVVGVQSVQRLATVWTVRGSNPGGEATVSALGPTQPSIQ
jgi:hypothetical protein